MTKPEEYTIHETIQMIEGGEIKLPIFQRRYVWSKEQVENLFSTVFNDNPFGAISAIKTTDDYPIFASRTFFEDLKDKFQLSEYNDGQNHSKENPLYLILDGQQRLQSFYLGLTSKFDDMELCFNKQNGTFKFCAEYDKNEYISVKQLYKKLGNNTYESVAKSFNADKKEIIDKNIFKFYYHFFFQQRIVMLLAYPSGNEQEDKEKLIDLFVRLNTGGTNLDRYDIYVSKLQAYNPLWEKLFIKIDNEFGNIMYYPYGIPFISSGKRTDKSPLDRSEYLQNYMSFIHIIYYCFNYQPNTIIFKQRLKNNSLDDISGCVKNENDINNLFNFILIVFDLCRIINIPVQLQGVFIYELYIEFINKQFHINIQEFTMNYYLSSPSYYYSRFKSKFANQNSWELFIIKYYLMYDINELREPEHIIHCQKDDNLQICEIQLEENKGNLHITPYDALYGHKYLLKYADDIVENELRNAKIEFKRQWEERAKKSAEWKKINEQKINNN